ncbi:hypothetical protein K469DRAFT_562197 [Zopfia rhizophila CBS 207.26]|uniref:Zn(2)-C6 fungal-type domain-containing protein n=1 Tax=Zopfia rhizophila CBS 207.26 TaxID=1314779 RepID=A0A6A6EE23_9PEZI|nr:hypothetical protein K469DRAFT_562197 [Zopfia rhizophila CBS 207.26]
MHILALPPPPSLPLTPFGRRQEPGSSLAKFPSQFSPGRSEQYSYPSPPMSDSQSPARRSAQLVEPEAQLYHPAASEARRREGIPPPPIVDPRSATSGQGIPQQRPLYPGERQPRGQPIHYQPGRVIEPPSYGGVQIPQNYAYGYPGAGVPTFLGGQGPGPQGQPTAIIAPPPLRPNKPARRTKAHVASACVNCKKAHLSCDVQRPCGRCVASGKQDSCKDVQHKKRGRPRLRDDKEFGRSEEGRPTPSQILGVLPTSRAEAFPQQSAFPSSHRPSDPLRVLRRSNRGSEDIPNISPQPIAQASRGRPSSVGSYGGVAPAPYRVGPNLACQALPVAFLNLDLVILKSNQAFQDLAAFLGDTRGKSLAELLEPRQTDILQRLRNELRDERDDREPAYMAPITPLGQDPIQSVAERDVDQISQGYTDRPHLLNFRLPNGQYQSLQTQIRLAKTSLYFVTLVVHTASRATGPTLLTQQLAPPTPIHASQTLSAPTTAPVRDFGPYPPRPSSSASSAPTSPYFNFSSVRTSLPQVPTGSGSYGSSPSYNYSPTAGPEQGYFPTIQPLSQPAAYPSPYPPVSRTGSVTSEPARRQEPSHGTNRPPRLEGLQLPPIRTAPAPLMPSPLGQEYSEDVKERVRRREASPTSAERPETPNTGKRRRLNIHEVLE